MKAHPTHMLAYKHPECLEYWSDKNEKSPDTITFYSSEKAWWKCPSGVHEDFLRSVVDSTGRRGFKCPKCSLSNPAPYIKKQSFYDYCIENNKSELLERWDYGLNDISPNKIAYKSQKKIFFKCSRGIHESSQLPATQASSLMLQNNLYPCKKCMSIAQWGIDNIGSDFLEKYWDYNLNLSNPWEIARHGSNKIWVKCALENTHPPYEVSCCNFSSQNTRCPYCAHRIILPENSLANKYPQSIEVWSKKNKQQPGDIFPLSNKKVWWSCKNGKHKDYLRSANQSVRLGFICPKCTEESMVSTLQLRVNEYLESTKYTILHELECELTPKNPVSGRPLRYDNQIKDLGIFIEVHGEQHYRSSSILYRSKDKRINEERFQSNAQRDSFKKEYVLSRGYSYLEIPYYCVLNGKYKSMIHDAIENRKLLLSKT
jgi:hypothetical protein